MANFEERPMSYARSLMLGLAFLALTASSGAAQQMLPLSNGLYVRGDLGGAFGADTTFKDTNPSSPSCTLCNTTQPSSTGNSVLFGAGVGYRFTPLFRSDVTLDYIPSLKVSGHNSALTGVTNSADLASLVGLLNGYLDLDGLKPGILGPLQPFLTAGVGFARNDLGKMTYGLTGVPSGALTQNGSTHTSFAWGVGAGMGYPLTSNLTLDLTYKYLDLGEMRSGSTATVFGASIASTPIKADLHVHTVILGVRFAFAGPPAPPPAPAAAAPAPVAAPAATPAPTPAMAKQEFIVFFDFDKANLTPEGQKIVDAAAAAYKKGGSAKISLAGYTDLAGTAPYNLKLSQRRAETVRAALVKDGVPDNQIAASWYGKEKPRVPTADGVREPQNRRVEIMF
jgi:OOP family OmpA-OmpF porin